jgi:Fe-S cluster assembly protein SufD
MMHSHTFEQGEHSFRFEVAAGERLHWHSVQAGEQQHTLNLHIELCGLGAEADIQHLVLGYGKGQFTANITVVHAHGRGISRQTCRQLAQHQAKIAVNSTSVVAASSKGLGQNDSQQSLKSLLLQPSAQIKAKPELQIFNDDVKASHGSTFGQLDAEALYYLRSRGISEHQARYLLLNAFAHEILQHSPDPAWGEGHLQRVLAS